MRERRLALGLTQPQAAARIGVCREALAFWEIRPRRPARQLMPAIIEFLGYNPLPPASSLSERLRRVRMTLGLNQQSFADALSLPLSTLKCWERGALTPSGARKALIEERLAALA